MFKLDLNIFYLILLQLFEQLVPSHIVFEYCIWIPKLAVFHLLIDLINYILLLHQQYRLLLQLINILLFLTLQLTNNLALLSIDDLLNFPQKLINSIGLLLILLFQLDKHLFIRFSSNIDLLLHSIQLLNHVFTNLLFSLNSLFDITNIMVLMHIYDTINT